MNFEIVPCLKSFKLDQNNVCDLCQKRIVKESELTDSDLTSDDEVCVVTTIKRASAAYLTDPIRITRMAILVVFGTSLFSLNAIAQDTIESIQSTYQEQPAEYHFQINGTIYDKTYGEPLPFVTIRVKDTKLGCHSDFDGRFALKLTSYQVHYPLTLQVEYIGFETMEIVIDEPLKPDQIHFLGDIEMIEDHNTISVGIIIYEVPEFDIMDPNAHRSTKIGGDELRKSPYRK
jgi:hypothetical protein